MSPPPEDTKLVSDTSTAKVYVPSNDTHVINAGKVVIQTIETDNAALTNIFGLKPKGLPFTIYMESGAGGAYHCHCPDTTLLVSSPYDAQVSAAYATAEMEEVYEHAINNGWNCDFTNGESLSRALAVYQHPQLRPLLAGTEIDWWSTEHSNPWDSEAEKKQLEQKKQLVWKQKIIEGAERGAAGLVLLVIAAYYLWRHRHQQRAYRYANQPPLSLENLE